MTSTEFFLISKSVITDSTLFFFFSMALVFFYLGYSTQQKNYYYGMYTGMALLWCCFWFLPAAGAKLKI